MPYCRCPESALGVERQTVITHGGRAAWLSGPYVRRRNRDSVFVRQNRSQLFVASDRMAGIRDFDVHGL
jgi:hypothetical protein